MKKKIFCYAPWTGVDISSRQKIRPCCRFGPMDSGLDVNTHTVDDYLNSPMLLKVKEDFENNVWPEECFRCRIEEENNIKSKRILDIERWGHYYNEYGTNQFLIASAVFGNVCNLKCIMCTPRLSSQWSKEYDKIYNVKIEPVTKVGFVDFFMQSCKNIKHLDISGGESFYSSIVEQRKILQYYVDNDKAKDITIHYITNCTVIPDSDLWDLWQHFKEIDLQLSIDSVGAQNDYIRFMSNWKNIVNNVAIFVNKSNELENLKLSISCTVTALSIYYLDEFVDWAIGVGLPMPWFGLCHKPNWLRPGIWPNKQKQIIYNKLSKSKYEEVRTWGEFVKNNDHSEYYELFLENIQKHDEYRETNVREVFKELEI